MMTASDFALIASYAAAGSYSLFIARLRESYALTLEWHVNGQPNHLILAEDSAEDRVAAIETFVRALIERERSELA